RSTAPPYYAVGRKKLAVLYCHRRLQPRRQSGLGARHRKLRERRNNAGKRPKWLLAHCYLRDTARKYFCHGRGSKSRWEPGLNRGKLRHQRRSREHGERVAGEWRRHISSSIDL